jgi:FkbM family methyltransferase
MKALIKEVASKLGYRVQGTRYIARHLLQPEYLRPLKLDDVICKRMFEHGPELTFIQVGAFDGVTVDPLRRYIDKYCWRGLLIEPQPGPANQLRQLYRGNDRISVIEAAIDCERGKRKLYTVESDEVPAWVRGMASFEKQHIMKHSALVPGLEGLIGEITVDVMPFNEVLNQLPATQLDLLQIDAEGADASLLILFPFDRLRPSIIHWEVKNLTKRQKEACFDRLSEFGYRFAASGDEDFMALLD